ncbi:MAG: DUF1549 domain-containing protein, partial [Planctomycetaceae bacterium]|nr:DUF1549 domain-containing protein [Planctomycetaceae bacterium]
MKTSSSVLFQCCLWFFLCSCSAMCAVPNDPDDSAFVTRIAPLLERHCLRCHSADQAEGELSLADAAAVMRSGIVVPRNPRESRLLAVVTAESGKRPEMPKDGPVLTAEEVGLLRDWIAAGAHWPANVTLRPRSKADAAWWSLQPVRNPQLPAVESGDQSADRNPLDRFIRRRLAEKGLQPSPQADARTLIRRLSFDLIGLPPTPEEVERFEHRFAESADGAYASLVDRLLASPHFGERWARHWLDIVHYADTHGFERDKRRDNAWRYRDYVIRAFNSDKPYDVFLREQIAGDVLRPDDAESVIATGFLAAGPWDFVGQV